MIVTMHLALSAFPDPFGMQVLVQDADNLPGRLRFQESYALPTFIANRAFYRVAVRFDARLFTLAVVAFFVAGASVNSSKSLLLSATRSFQNTTPGHAPMYWLSSVGTWARVPPFAGLTLSPAPPCAGMDTPR